MIRNVFFDMGKCVLDYTSLPAVRQYTDDPAMIRKIGNAVFYSTGWTFLDAGFVSEEYALEKMLTHLDTDEERDIARKAFRTWPEYNIRPNHEMASLVHALKEGGIHIFLVSNASVRMRGVIDRLLPNPEDYEGYLFSAEVHYLKPQKEIYEIACRTFGAEAEETAFVDDLPINIAGAEKAGLTGILFDGSAEHLRDALAGILPEKAAAKLREASPAAFL